MIGPNKNQNAKEKIKAIVIEVRQIAYVLMSSSELFALNQWISYSYNYKPSRTMFLMKREEKKSRGDKDHVSWNFPQENSNYKALKPQSLTHTLSIE